MSSERPYFLVLESPALHPFLQEVVSEFNIPNIRVMGVTSPDDAQSVLDNSEPEERPDVLIIDWGALTVIDRLGYIRKLRENGSSYKGTPIFILSAEVNSALLLETIKYGCEIEQKPFNVAEFELRVLEKIDESESKAA